MSMQFATRLVALRKERGISQKQAAADLGVSQALLSHYEKGIRECGLAFLCRCAEYYAVTADYLLNMSDIRQWDAGEEAQNANVQEDFLTAAGVRHAAEKLLDGKAQEGELDALSRMQSILLYQVLLVKAASGALPRDWVPQCKALHNPLYLAQLHALSDQLAKEVQIGEIAKQKQAPSGLQTLVRETQSYVEQAAQKAFGKA